MRSFTGSTGRHPPSGGQRVAYGVHVSVVGRAAGSRPGSDVQRLQGAADGAQLGEGKKQSTAITSRPVPLGSVLQQAAELGPCRIADGAGQAPVPDHVSHGQVLDHDRLVFTNEPSGQLVQAVTASVGVRAAADVSEARMSRTRCGARYWASCTARANSRAPIPWLRAEGETNKRLITAVSSTGTPSRRLHRTAAISPAPLHD